MEPIILVAGFYRNEKRRIQLENFFLFEQNGYWTRPKEGTITEFQVTHSKSGMLYDSCSLMGVDAAPILVEGLYWTPYPDLVIECPAKWADPETAARNPTERLKRLPYQFRRYRDFYYSISLWGRFLEAPPVYCEECDDHMADDDLCKHLFWCDGCQDAHPRKSKSPEHKRCFKEYRKHCDY